MFERIGESSFEVISPDILLRSFGVSIRVLSE